MRKFLLFTVLLLSAPLLFGQVEFGVNAGYRASTLSAKPDTVVPAFGSGFHVGGFARIGKKFFLQPEFCYTYQTSTVSGDLTSWEQRTAIGSLDIPILGGIRFLNSEKARIRLMAGPVVSFVVNRKITDLTDIPGPLGNGDINNINWGLQAGAGVDLYRFSLDIRYQFGLNNVIREVGTTVWNSKNSIWIIGLGFRI